MDLWNHVGTCLSTEDLSAQEALTEILDDAAAKELARASELDPSTSRYRKELERVEKSRNEHNNLVEQGLGK